MKKLAILASAVLLAGSTFAQRPVDSNPFSLEGGLSLNSASNTFSAPMIRFRYFVTDNIAARVGLQLNNSKTVEYIYGASNDEKGTYTTSTNANWVSVGASYHFSQLERLSPYAAVDLLFGFGKDSFEGEDVNAGGTSYSSGVTYNGYTKTFGFGAALSAGFDYYFAKNVFIGAELGLQFTTTKDKGGKYTYSPVSGTETTTDIPEGGHVNTFANSYTTALRLGWRF